MKLSKRERALLENPFLMALWLMFYRFYMEPILIQLDGCEEEIREIQSRMERISSRKSGEQEALSPEEAGQGQLFYRNLTAGDMDRILRELAVASQIELLSFETGETSPMGTAGFYQTPVKLEFRCAGLNQWSDLAERIGSRGLGLQVKEVSLWEEETKDGAAGGRKGTMTVMFCHENE